MIITNIDNNTDSCKFYMWCPNCGYHYLNPYEKSLDDGCYEEKCPACDDGIMYDIDYNIFDIIINLNKKGYRTFACCEGHKTGNNETLPRIGFCTDDLYNNGFCVLFETISTILIDLYHIDVDQVYFDVYLSFMYETKYTFEEAKEIWLTKMREVVDKLPCIGGE